MENDEYVRMWLSYINDTIAIIANKVLTLWSSLFVTLGIVIALCAWLINTTPWELKQVILFLVIIGIYIAIILGPIKQQNKLNNEIEDYYRLAGDILIGKVIKSKDIEEQIKTIENKHQKRIMRH